MLRTETYLVLAIGREFFRTISWVEIGAGYGMRTQRILSGMGQEAHSPSCRLKQRSGLDRSEVVQEWK